MSLEVFQKKEAWTVKPESKAGPCAVPTIQINISKHDS